MLRRFKNSLSSGVGRELGKALGSQALERAKRAAGELREMVEESLKSSNDTDSANSKDSERDVQSRLREIENNLSYAERERRKAEARQREVERELDALKAKLEG